MKLEIVYLRPQDLTPYEGNTRKHNPEDIDGIKKSITDVGFADPIGIWGEENLIVEGHGRQIAAIELGLDKVPCIRLDEMTEDQRREYAIRHNRSAEMSAWDFGKLEEELAALELQGIDMEDLKFGEIGGGIPIPDNLDAEEDYSPEAPIAGKLTFHNYAEYARHEEEMKRFAEEIGAEFSVVKA